MATSLVGEVAFITGASRGIGAECAFELARHGAAVALAARSTDALAGIAGTIRDAGGRALAVECDVSNSASVQAAVDMTTGELGDIDILINNAGMVDPIARIEKLSPQDFDTTLQANLHGAFYCVHAVLPGMQRKGGGTIVNVSSGAAHRPLEGWASYCVSKAGMFMLTQALVHELGDQLRVFGFQPGTVDTEMQGLIRESGLNPISQLTREQHRPPHIPAGVIRYLCTAAADDLAGQEIAIADDGLLARAGFA